MALEFIWPRELNRRNVSFACLHSLALLTREWVSAKQVSVTNAIRWWFKMALTSERRLIDKRIEPFVRHIRVQRSAFPEGPCVSALNADFSYPYTVEHHGQLYIGYTRKSHFANEPAVIPFGNLEIQPSNLP